MYSKGNPDGYALALFELLKEQKLINKTYDFFSDFENFTVENQDLLKVLSNVNETKEERYAFVDEINKKLEISKLTDTFANFLKVLIERNNSQLLPRIISIYLRFAEEELNIAKGTIYTAYPIEEAKLQKIVQKLEKSKNKHIILKNKIDKSLISGFKIVIGNEIIEQNSESDLQKLLLILTRKGGLNG